jgi:putative ABC transport system permease protein
MRRIFRSRNGDVVVEMFQGIVRDLAYAARSLAKARAFTFVCVVSLGIGMAPVIAIPYAARISNIPPTGLDTEGLVEVLTTPLGSRGADDMWSYPDFVDLRDAATGMVMTGWAMGESEITPQTPAEAKTASTMFVSSDYFRTIGVTLVRGPGFDAKRDGALTSEPVVILGYRFWQNQLGFDPNVIGKTLTLDGTPHVVVGIAPDQFDGIDTKELFVPLERHPRLRPGKNADNNVRADRGTRWVHIRGRLSPGVSLAQASAAVSGVTSRLAKQYPVTNEFTAGVAKAYDPIGNLQRPQIRILEAIALTLTGTVLLVVCLNISGMMQVRSAMRERELSIRQAVGASRWRLVQHLLSEAIVVAGLGGALASVVLFNIPSVLPWWIDRPLPSQVQEALRVDLSMIAICVGLCLLTSVVCGFLSATRFSRPAIVSSLKDDVGVGGFRVGRVHRVTAALQVAIAVPLIVMSGMSLDRFRATATSDLGFASDLLYAAPLKLGAAANEDAGFRIRTVRNSLEKASGVASVTVADGLPLGFSGSTMRVSAESDANAAPAFVSVHVTRVGDGYLDTMGIPLVRGRDFNVDDGAGAEMVTVISKPLADRLFPNAGAAEALGKRLTFGAADPEDKTQHTLTIVGVTGDFPTSQMSTRREQLLLPLSQHPSPNVFLIARSAPGEQEMKLNAALVNAVRDLGPDFNQNVKTPDGVLYSSIVTGVWLRENSMRDFLVQSAVAGTAGSVILMLAALGIYGVVGLMVATRTREIAVRVALGSSRRGVMGLILLDVVKLVSPGVAVGLVLTAVLNRLNGENMGIPLSGMEPLAYVVGGAIAVLVAVLASLVPARRAASIQPMAAMRSV